MGDVKYSPDAYTVSGSQTVYEFWGCGNGYGLNALGWERVGNGLNALGTGTRWERVGNGLNATPM